VLVVKTRSEQNAEFLQVTAGGARSSNYEDNTLHEVVYMCHVH